MHTIYCRIFLAVFYSKNYMLKYAPSGDINKGESTAEQTYHHLNKAGKVAVTRKIFPTFDQL
jgi:hypothetical protein